MNGVPDDKDGLFGEDIRARTNEQIQLQGFMAGLARTRKSLGDREFEKGRDDPFLVGYRQGATARADMVHEAAQLASGEVTF